MGKIRKLVVLLIIGLSALVVLDIAKGAKQLPTVHAVHPHRSRIRSIEPALLVTSPATRAFPTDTWWNFGWLLTLPNAKESFGIA